MLMPVWRTLAIEFRLVCFKENLAPSEAYSGGMESRSNWLRVITLASSFYFSRLKALLLSLITELNNWICWSFRWIRIYSFFPSLTILFWIEILRSKQGLSPLYKRIYGVLFRNFWLWHGKSRLIFSDTFISDTLQFFLNGGTLWST